jgi:PAS domain S-box-containing protein
MPGRIFKTRLLMGVVLPVLITGVLFSLIIIRFFLPPIIADLKGQTDATLKNASNMALSICEERQNIILELRLEDNLEMDIASKKEAIEQIKQISRMSPGIQVMVLEKDGTVIAGSFEVPVDRLDLGNYPRNPHDVISEKLGDHPVKIHYHYFPFWGWYVVSMIFEKDYMKPIQMARQTVLLGTFGVLLAVLAALLVSFIRRINRPLEAIIRATESVAKGKLKPLIVKGQDEISQVSMAFNAMVHSLIRDKEKINAGVRELQRSEEQYKVLTESSLTNIAMIRNNTFVFANRRMLESLHYESTEFIGMSLWNIIHPADSGLVQKRIQDLKIGGPDMDHFECCVLSKNGKILWFEMIAAPVLYREQDAILIHAIDITVKKTEQQDRKKLEEMLTQAQKMEAVGQLAGGIAHDFNNMLGVIIGYTELLLEQVGPSQQFHAELEEILKASRRSADLTRQLLTFARKQTVALRVLDLNQTIEGMLNMLRRLIGENISLIWMPGSGLWPINMDPSQIDQILANLCVNARDAIKGVGKLTVETKNTTFDKEYCATHAGSLPGEYVQISVSDTGDGMDKETMAHIFEPFFTTKNVGEGSGLGLATVYGAVKQNNGFINVYSEPGQGTTFTIYIPRHFETTTDAQITASTESVEHGDEIVLLVEDEPKVLQMSKTMLERLGYTVLAAGTPNEAIRLADGYSGQIHLLATDVIMPGMNGRELSARLMETRPEMKCLYMSGYTANIIANQGVLKEGVSFLQKPFSKK